MNFFRPEQKHTVFVASSFLWSSTRPQTSYITHSSSCNFNLSKDYDLIKCEKSLGSVVPQWLAHKPQSKDAVDFQLRLFCLEFACLPCTLGWLAIHVPLRCEWLMCAFAGWQGRNERISGYVDREMSFEFKIDFKKWLLRDRYGLHQSSI